MECVAERHEAAVGRLLHAGGASAAVAVIERNEVITAGTFLERQAEWKGTIAYRRNHVVEVAAGSRLLQTLLKSF